MRFHLLPAALVAAAFCQAQYSYGPDSSRQPGVPKGKVTQHKWTSTKHFPGTVRDYWIYVPSQYKPDRPSPVMVFQDGGGYVSETGHSRIPIVFDNLIHKGEMPSTIAILINPGILPALSPDQQSRYNRSFEYDAMSDTYARFLIEEILPEVGKSYNLSSNPDDRAIAGSSSGGIAAFTAAWHRPDAFHRVLSFVGSYTNLRGGHHWPSMIRKTEGKPLRVYLQDGRNDQNIYSGNWFIGNQDMASALEYAGYDTTFVIGEEGHNMRHGGPIMPDALRWLWREYPKPIAKPVAGGSRRAISEFLDPASEWEMVASGYKFTEGPAVDKDGNIFFTDIPNSRIHRIGADGKVNIFQEDSGGANGLMFGPDGKLYACQNRKQRIVAYSMDGAETVLAEGVTSNDIVVTAGGNIYFTDPPKKSVWLIDAQRKRRVVHEGIEFPNGVMLSPDQSLLSVADYRGNRVWSFQIQPDGSLANGQPFYKLEVPDEAVASAADGMTVDSEGFLYVATRLGIQICDQPGRVVGIINKPHGGALANAVFAGKDLSWLYVTAGDRVYRRHMRRTGVWPWAALKPPQPRL